MTSTEPPHQCPSDVTLAAPYQEADTGYRSLDKPAVTGSKQEKPSPTPRTHAGPEEPRPISETPKGPSVKLSQARKWVLLAIFSAGIFIDIWGYSAFYVFTSPVCVDLSIPFSQQAWVIGSYSLTFASFLLFWGRFADVYSPKPVFIWGLLSLGVLNLILSFLTERYSFLIIRAISGIAGGCLIPAGYRLITAIFEPHELHVAFTLYGFSGVFANVIGIIIAAAIETIPQEGQGAPWRWFFRILAIIIAPLFALAYLWLPETHDERRYDPSSKRWKRLDIVGSFTLLVGIVLLTLGLTFGASYGFRTPEFLVPFLLSPFALAAFLVWEARLPSEMAILPPKTWRLPNFGLYMFVALYQYGWYAVNYLLFIERWINVYHEAPIIAALRSLPQGASAGILIAILSFLPKLISKPRWPTAGGLMCGIIGYVLFTRGNHIGSDYWRYTFPGSIIGAAGMIVTFNGINIGILRSVPPEMAGVAGAASQVAFQVGAVIALSISSGLLTVNEGSISNIENLQASFYFQIGWGIVALIVFLAAYRDKPVPKAAQDASQEAHEDTQSSV